MSAALLARARRAATVMRSMPPAASILLAGVVLLPAITSAERVTFTVGGIHMNVRVATYFAIAGIAALAAIPIAIRMHRRPAWFVLMGVMLGWLLLTSLAAGQRPVEWVPTIVRFLLYFSAALIFYGYVRSVDGPTAREGLAWWLPIVVLVMSLIPAIAGMAELLRGDAPLLNGARRISGSMFWHPVAFSLVLAISAMATVGPAIIRGRGVGAIARWVAIGGLTFVIFLTYTRLTVLLLASAAVIIPALLPAPSRLRIVRVAGMLIAGAAIVLLAQPLFEARFTYDAPLRTVIDQPNVTPPPGTTPSFAPSLRPDEPWDIEIDASLGYRVKLTQRAIAYIAESPIIGHGPGSFDRLNEADTGIAGVAAHNDFLLFAVETGIPGMVIYGLVLLSLAVALWPRGSTGHRQVDALIVTALVILGTVDVAAAIHNPTYFVEVQLPIWILVGAGLGFRERLDPVRPKAGT